MTIISVQELSHSFGRESQILNNINLSVPEGSIYGFLGANGAGKSTTLKLILGLLRTQAGHIHIFGTPFYKNRLRTLSRIGSFIENPSFYDNLTARENLLIQQKIYACPLKNIDEVLELVGLSQTKGKLAKSFSLGMKQRLGIAIAFLHKPDLLILDEPTNGLDPNGMIEMRELLKSINQIFKTTILISSHLLSEIEKLATHIGIIHRGQMCFEGTISALMQKNVAYKKLSICTSNNENAQRLLPYAEIHDTALVVSIRQEQDIARTFEILAQNHIQVLDIDTEKTNLEDIFMNFVNQ